ncbi:putative ABC transport system ATP-binding protein [Rhodovulum sulfidophilum]|uniref:ABC transporter ATP-binding protein n=1 Tax=Rhodovulum sulfidophilum TaxID=35806 RepID=UPI0005A82448|nr:ATP-binding cassette domain-containing protein [Rhodovulum sulfidophilum]ANB34482.1 ABC transporter [Rhodovulum sulfidophilum DSM 1374]ANB38304.1 ABC transporter [Rhodovulum sulfidophilum]MCW2303657.1 putative ABC transport system ATP-binding protein [Rhodovulum sulfidophilum]
MPDLRLSSVSVAYPGLAAPVLDIPALDIPAGSRIAVTGPSGSGKSTLVNVLAGLVLPRAGRVVWDGTDIAALSEGARDRWRGANLGLVMQEFHLFPGLSALDNVLLPARLSRVADQAMTTRAGMLLAEVGLSRPDQPVETMSRGEMQRVAVARAVLRAPGIIVADEPTASLDPESGVAIAGLLLALAESSGATLIVVSHDRRLSARLDRVLSLAEGAILSDDVREGASP